VTTWFKSATKLAGLCMSALLLLFPMGCSTPSLNKAYTAETLERVTGIEGEWVQIPKPGEEPEFMLVIAASKDSLYNVDIRGLKPKTDEPASPQRILVGFTKVNGQLFADATADFTREPLLGHYRDYIIPAHVFAHVTFDGTTLAVSPMSGSGLEKLLKDKPDSISHAAAEDSLVLTADTSRIREFLAAQQGNTDLFQAEPMRFGRAPAAK
jgi:hypothetical protein